MCKNNTWNNLSINYTFKCMKLNIPGTFLSNILQKSIMLECYLFEKQTVPCYLVDDLKIFAPSLRHHHDELCKINTAVNIVEVIIVWNYDLCLWLMQLFHTCTTMFFCIEFNSFFAFYFMRNSIWHDKLQRCHFEISFLPNLLVAFSRNVLLSGKYVLSQLKM